MKACSVGFSRSMRSSNAFVTSRGESVRRAKAADSSLTVANWGSVTGILLGDLHAPHEAAEGARIIDGEVLDAAIVPEGDGALLPAEAARELGAVAVLEQEIEERLALRLRHALEADRVGGIDVEERAARLGMRPDDWVDGDRLAPRVVVARFGGAARVDARLRARDLAIAVDGA